jgi:hypothetical protein
MKPWNLTPDALPFGIFTGNWRWDMAMRGQIPLRLQPTTRCAKQCGLT